MIQVKSTSIFYMLFNVSKCHEGKVTTKQKLTAMLQHLIACTRLTTAAEGGHSHVFLTDIHHCICGIS